MATTAFPISPSFAGHETFTLRYGWLKKAVDAVHEDPLVFTRDDALVRLGVGKNMVRSIRHWGLATGILEEDTSELPSPRSRGEGPGVRVLTLFFRKLHNRIENIEIAAERRKLIARGVSPW